MNAHANHESLTYTGSKVKTEVKVFVSLPNFYRKRKRSDSVVLQKPLYHQKMKAKRQHENATKTAITQRFRTYLGRSVGVTTVIKLAWLNRFMGSQPSK